MRSSTAGSCASTFCRRARRAPPGHLAPADQFLFDCGAFRDERLKEVKLQADEIDEYCLAEMDEALALLSGPLRRRVLEGGEREAVSLPGERTPCARRQPTPIHPEANRSVPLGEACARCGTYVQEEPAPGLQCCGH